MCEHRLKKGRKRTATRDEGADHARADFFLCERRKKSFPQLDMAPARANSSRATASERLVLIPAVGWFATAEEAALFYARREAGRDTSDLTAPPPPPPPSSTSAELPVYELSILTPEQMAAVPNSPPSNLDYSRARRRGVWRQAHDYAAALALGALAAAPTYGSPSGSASART